MDEIKAEIEKLRLAREAATSEIVEEIKSEIDKMKEVRQTEYANILNEIKDMKSDSKMTKYKLTSAIKHTSHVHTARMNEIKDEIQKLHSSSISTQPISVGLLPLPDAITNDNTNNAQVKIHY